jgi:hypothetical protein
MRPGELVGLVALGVALGVLAAVAVIAAVSTGGIC